MRLLIFLLALAFLFGALPVEAEVPFTAEQASRGGRIYLRECAYCHGERLWDGAASPLVGPDFRAVWSGAEKTLFDLFDVTRSTMPVAAEGTLSLQETADLLAFILGQNGYPAGEELLPAEPEALKSMRLSPSPEPSRAEPPPPGEGDD